MSYLKQPWKIEPVDAPFGEVSRIVDASVYLVATVDSRIAAKVCAVEELYESLNAISQAIDDEHRLKDGTWIDNPGNLILSISQSAHAALAKARGE